MKNSTKLSFAERERISILRAKGYGVRRVARALARSPGTLSEELNRNGLCGGEYKAVSAQWSAENRPGK